MGNVSKSVTTLLITGLVGLGASGASETSTSFAKQKDCTQADGNCARPTCDWFGDGCWRVQNYNLAEIDANEASPVFNHDQKSGAFASHRTKAAFRPPIWASPHL